MIKEKRKKLKKYEPENKGFEMHVLVEKCVSFDPESVETWNFQIL